MGAEYEPLEVIGHGSFGQIRKVRRRRDGEVFVRKEVSYRSMNPKERTQLIAEFRILKSLDHPNIVKYLHHEHVSELHELHLYMEYCSGGDLAHLIREYAEHGVNPPEHEVWGIMVQMLQALYRCHYNRMPPPTQLGGPDHGDEKGHHEPTSVILHRDIKPENIFMGSGGNVKLGDFGLAKLLDHENPLAHTYVGTPYYMSPEVLTDRPATPASDIWSLGCVIYELCTLRPPFLAKSHNQLSQKIQEGTFPPLPSKYSSALTRTIAACLQVNPAMRPTTATLLRLDVVRIHRKERELQEREYLLSLREQRLNLEEENLKQRLDQLDEYIEELEDRLRHAPPVSPSRALRGPRHYDAVPSSYHEPVSGRHPLDDMSNQYVPSKHAGHLYAASENSGRRASFD